MKTVTLNQLVGPSLLGCEATLYFKYLVLFAEVNSLKSLPIRPTMVIFERSNFLEVAWNERI